MIKLLKNFSLSFLTANQGKDLILDRFLSFIRQCGTVYRKNHTVYLPSYLSGADDKTVQIISEHFKVYENFVSEDEEKELMTEIDPIIKRRRYEKDHWDDVSNI